MLTNLRTFLAVTSAGNFSDAGRQMSVVPSVVAKRITQLEAAMQSRLFDRSTRQMPLTEAGRRLRSRAAALVSNFEDVIHDVERDEGKLEGHIRLMAPTTLTLLRLGSVLDGFLAQHERITLEISLMDRSTNPLEAGLDLAISGRSASYEGVIDVPLCPVRPKLCAAPAYLERRGSPAHPRELAGHDCLIFRPAGESWVFQSSRGLVQVDVVGKLIADDNLTLLQAAKGGRGIAVLPHYVCSEALATHEVTLLLDAFPPQDAWFKAYVPRRRHHVPRIQALLKWLSAMLQEEGQPTVQHRV